MVTMSNYQTAANATSYLEKDNYYIKDGITEKGEWNGETSKDFGLSGAVDIKNDFYSLANGIRPGALDKDGIKTLQTFDKIEENLLKDFNNLQKLKEDDPSKEVLLKDYTARVEEYNSMRKEFNTVLGDDKLIRDTKDKETGILSHTRAGFDLTFSAPKSLSILGLVAGDTRLLEAHSQATKESMAYVEKHFAQTRVYNENGNRERVTTSNLAFASFTHNTSRAVGDNMPDPQVHTHNFIFNLTKVGNEYKSLDNVEISQHIKLAGQIYQSSLASMVKELGYSVEWDKKGGNYTFEIKGVDKELIENYSKRTEQIEEKIKEMELEKGRPLSDEEKNIITLNTRTGKESLNMESLHSDWDKQLSSFGISKEELLEKTKELTSDKSISSDIKEAIQTSIKTLEEKQSVYSQHEILHEALKITGGQFSKEAILDGLKENTKDIKSLVNDTDTVYLANRHTNKLTELYTSKAVLRAEANIYNILDNGKNTGQVMDEKSYLKIMDSQKDFQTLTKGQREASIHIATSNDRLIGIQGDAGVGKTTLVAQLKDAMAQLNDAVGDKINLIGLAPTGKAAKELEDAAGVKSQTIDSFLFKKSDQSEKQNIYIVDESSMNDTFKLEKLLLKADEENSKVVLIGDIKQFKPVGAGDMFKALQENSMSTVKMEESLRQKTKLTKAVVKDFKNGNILDGLEKLSQAGKFHEAQKKEDGTRDIKALDDKFITKVNELYSEKGFDSTLVLVSTNKERQNFNNAIRSEMQNLGLISNENFKIDILTNKNLSLADKQFAGNYKEGDIITFNKGFQDIKKNEENKVLEIDKSTNKIQIEYQTKDTENPTATKWIDGTNLKNTDSYTPDNRDFSTGDKISFEKNNNDLGVMNGEIGYVKSVDEKGNFIIEKESGQEVAIDPKEYNSLNHAYVLTNHKAQGQSIDNVLVYADAKSQNLNAGYVEMSRAKQDIEVFTNNREALERNYEIEQIKENASDYISKNEILDNLQTLTATTGESLTLEDNKAIEQRLEQLKEDIANSLGDGVKSNELATQKDPIEELKEAIQSIKDEIEANNERRESQQEESSSNKDEKEELQNDRKGDEKQELETKKEQEIEQQSSKKNIEMELSM